MELVRPLNRPYVCSISSVVQAGLSLYPDLSKIKEFGVVLPNTLAVQTMMCRVYAVGVLVLEAA